VSEVGEVASWSGRALLVFFALSLVLHIVFIAVYSASQFLLFGILATWSPNISAIIVLAFVLREESGVRRLVRRLDEVEGESVVVSGRGLTHCYNFRNYWGVSPFWREAAWS